MEETIAAVSTPFGQGAIAMIRLSGREAVAVAEKIFRGNGSPAEYPPRVQHFGKIHANGELIDKVMLTVFRAPRSYTGEDVIEITCHGGTLVISRILQAALDQGARVAEPGEFTQRAFLNGKLDLTQAEAVMDLINAQTTLALRAAAEQLEGRLGARIREIREELLGIVAHVEACIDFPDEDIDPDTGDALMMRVRSVQTKVDSLLQTAGQGRTLREGVRTVIYGAPNVGKSSLLNLLLGFERAIVSEMPGTTRDTIEEVINLRGIPLRLIDTAGMRESVDVLEQKGMARTLRDIERADLVLHMADASQPKSQVLWAAEKSTRHNELFILNKTDLGEDQSWKGVPALRISCLTEQGIQELGESIFRKVMGAEIASGAETVTINARHQHCLNSAAEYLRAAQNALAENLFPELIAIELRAALNATGAVVGLVETDELLGKIFSTFCIGK
jgi:tRNA modification GTPase